MILVTGGTGLVGSHLLYKLTKNNKKVRAIYRRAHKLESVKHVFSYYIDDYQSLYDRIDWVDCDISDIPKLNEVFKGITHVYHCAAFVSFEPDKYKLLRKINIKGTANIVNCCISHSVKKLCYVSSIAALGHHQDAYKLIDETTAWNPEEDHSVYAITKYGAELEVWRGSQEGVDVVIVNPGIILGPGFWHGGGSSGLFKQVYKGLKYYTTGVTGYVDVWDVVDPMILLMAGQHKNEGYILVSENISFKDFIFKTAEELKVAAPKKVANPWLLQLAWRLDWLTFKLFGKRRRLSKHMAESACTMTLYDHNKVKTALNYKFKPIDESVKEVCALFMDDLQ